MLLDDNISEKQGTPIPRETALVDPVVHAEVVLGLGQVARVAKCLIEDLR